MHTVRAHDERMHLSFAEVAFPHVVGNRNKYENTRLCRRGANARYVAQAGNSDRLNTYVPHVENAAAVMTRVMRLGPMPAITKSRVLI